MSSIRIFLLTCLLLLVAVPSVSSRRNKPNIIFVLTDDQDVILGGLNPIKKTIELIGKQGAMFTNMFVTTPLCCPSRASILTGKYAHNHGVVNNSITGNCNSKAWQKEHEPSTFVTALQKAGYTTYYSGKYLNQYGKKSVGGISHVPPGWHHWNALVGNSCYYNYTLSVNGTPEHHGSNPQSDYLTDVIFTKATNFLENHDKKNPFFMFLSPPSPHSPFTPAPQYSSWFSGMNAPRTPSFNAYSGKSKHWLLRQPPHPLPYDVIKSIDEVFRNRWRTLLSVDDGIKNIFHVLKKQNLLQDTFIFFSSDNGFHLGQFSLPWDKRQPYEFDIRIPLLVKGPGIKPESMINEIALNIDLAPTFLSLANIKPASDMDGLSLSALLFKRSKGYTERTNFIVEHKGEASDRPIPGCPQYKVREVDTCEIGCICEDSSNNTYKCVRKLSSSENTIVCHFMDNEDFIEAYNITDDPFQLKNIYPIGAKLRNKFNYNYSL